jgi:hypothetical protein
MRIIIREKMRIFHIPKKQLGQGLVEFALTVPIVLVLFLGIIGFAHYCFTYFTVVSASRDAARWGAAVGTSANGFPRYNDCDAIKDAAVRTGGVVGVKADQINISYDHWENGLLTSPVSSCPYDDAQLNDRIIVEVWIDYTPLTTVVNIPPFRLSAITKRTIVLKLPVGVIPTTGPIEPLTYIFISPSPDAEAISSITGEEQTFNITVTANDGSVPTGTLTFKDLTTDQNSSCGASFSPPSPAGSSKSCSFTFIDVGSHTLMVNYTPTGQYIGALPETLLWVVLPEDST